MVQVQIEQNGNSKLVRLTGAIEENVDLEALIGDPGPDLIVSSKGVTRINSIGVKTWIKTFQTFAQKGTKITLTECSIPIVEQINLISNFSAGAAIESVYCPYLCQDCGADYVVLFKTEDVAKVQFQLPKSKCAKCGGANVEFDDIADDYFYFMTST